MKSESNSPRTSGPRKMTEIMRSTMAAIPTVRSPSSSITTPRGRDETRSARFPAGISATGSGALATRSGQVPEVIRAFGLPMETAGTLGPLLAPLLSWGEASLFSGDQFDGTSITGVVVRPGAPRVAVEKALAHVESICRPCHADLAAQELAHLRVLTVHRQRDPKEMQLVAVAYTQRLAEYPVDVVIAACKAWADREEFWPSWAELKAEADKRMRGRLQIRDALRRAAA